MSRNRIPDRKRKRIIKKYLILTSGVFVLLIVIVGIFLLFAPKQSFVSPLPMTLGFQTESTGQMHIDEIKQQLTEKSIDYQSVSASKSGYTIDLKSGEQIILSPQKDIDLQISSLQFILSRLT